MTTGAAEQDQDTIEYKFAIPEHPFTVMEKYSLMFEEVCDTNNISREGSRTMKHLINEMLADERLGKRTSSIETWGFSQQVHELSFNFSV